MISFQNRGRLQVQGSELLKIIWKGIWAVRLRKFADDTDYSEEGAQGKQIVKSSGKMVEWLGNETGSEIQVM